MIGPITCSKLTPTVRFFAREAQRLHEAARIESPAARVEIQAMAAWMVAAAAGYASREPRDRVFGTIYVPCANDLVFVSLAQERRARPSSKLSWYHAVVLKVERREGGIFYRLDCKIEHHADASRPLYVRIATPGVPTTDWDAVMPRVSEPRR